MFGARGVHVDWHTPFGKSPRAATVVKVDVRQQECGELFWFDTKVTKPLVERLAGARWPRLNQHPALWTLHCPRGNSAWYAHMKQVN